MRVNRKGDGDMVVYTAFVPRTKLVKEVEVLNCQEAEEEAPEFISRVKSKAKVCEFIVMFPTAEDSGQDMSYSDKLCSHVTVRGLEDIQDSMASARSDPN